MFGPSLLTEYYRLCDVPLFSRGSLYLFERMPIPRSPWTSWGYKTNSETVEELLVSARSHGIKVRAEDTTTKLII